MSVKSGMHPRNIYNKPPDYREMAISYPSFRRYLKRELNGRLTLDYSDPNALKELTCTLLKKDFDLDVDINESRLIPRVPVCLNYILWIEDLLESLEEKTSDTLGIDIGTGSVCIYSLLGARKGWKMLATEVDEFNYKNAEHNIKKNNLENFVSLKLVSTSDKILQGVIDENSQYDFCMCNPPFYDFEERPQNRTCKRKLLDTTPSDVVTEIATKGGEIAFLTKLMEESERLQGKVKIYTTLIGKKSDFKQLRKELRKYSPKSVAATEFIQGRTMRWGLAWSFLDINLRVHSGPPRMKPKKKSKPVEFILPDIKKESFDAVVNTTRTLLGDLKIKFSEEMSHPSVLFIFKAYKNTWSHQRQKKRLLKRITTNLVKNNSTNQTNQDTNESDEKECSEAKRQKLETKETEETCYSHEPLVEGSILYRTEKNSIILEMMWMSGNKESFHQIFQYFKNYWRKTDCFTSE